MDEKIFKEVQEILKCWGESVIPDTDLRRDLGMDGDDAVEFMDSFAARFGVDMTEFNVSDHFGPEGFSLFSTLWLLFSGRTSDVRAPITVRDLVEAAEQKRWRRDKKSNHV